MQAEMLKELEKGFPEGVSLDDINDPQDWAYLLEWLNGFFGRTVPSQKVSNPSSEIATSGQDSGLTTS